MNQSEVKIKPKKPRLLKGFRDFFAEDMKLREFVIGTFKRVFEKYGYEPLETPALEYAELMLGQSGDEAEKQYYRFKDPGGRDVMLKFEVMISMCRAVAQNIDKLPLPYKRYQIQRTWRAENTQRGRYREFTQCDADTIGSSSMLCDAEFIQMGLEIVGELGFKEYVARISNRKFLGGMAEYLGVDCSKLYGYFMSIDKLPKRGRDFVLKELEEKRGISKEIAEKTLEMIAPEKYKGQSVAEIVASFKDTVGSTETGNEGLSELLEIDDYFKVSKVDESLYKFDTSIARGLASYTGPVWEFEVIDGGVGSIGGCGRYDRAIGKYIGREIPATGGSFGIERITDIIKEKKMLDLGQTNTDVLVTIFDDDLSDVSVVTAGRLRNKDLAVMLYPNGDALKKQFKYADRKGIPWVVVIGPDEAKEKKIQLKNMKTGEQDNVSLDECAATIKAG